MDHAPSDDLSPGWSKCVIAFPGAPSRLRLRVTTVFGRKLFVSYFSGAQTAEEADVEGRDAADARDANQRDLARLQEELGVVLLCEARQARQAAHRR